MNKAFDFEDISSVEFGVGYGEIGEKDRFVPIDDGVGQALRQMLRSTHAAFSDTSDDWAEYEPAEQYGPSAKLRVSIKVAYMSKLRTLYAAKNLPALSGGIQDTQSLAFYFGTFADGQGRKLLGVRRAAQFKAVLKAQNRLISWLDDTLRVVGEDVFRLDNDFDFLVSTDTVWVLHPASLEALTDLGGAIQSCVADHATELQARAHFIDFKSLGAFAANHRFAARLIASLHARQDLEGISVKLLDKACRQNGIGIAVEKGVLRPESGSELALLQLLDRRRYQLELVKDAPERYVASGRRPVKRSGVNAGAGS